MSLKNMRRQGTSAMIFLCLLFCAVAWGTAYAANSTVILDRERDRPQNAPLSRPKPPVEEGAAESRSLSHDTELTLQSLSVSGSTVFSEGELLAPYRDLFGKRISYERLRGISAEMTKKYREAGYILSRVILPAQDVDPANAHIQLIAIEGFIDAIEYSGDSRVLERFKRYFSSIEKDLLGMKPLKHSAFERQMLLMKDVSGLEISSRFERGDLPGASKLHIDVQGDLLEGSFNMGNTGTDETGPIIGSVSVGLNTLPLIGNKATVTYTQAFDYREYHSIQIADRYQLWNGLTFTASYAYSDSPDMDADLVEDLDYRTDSSTYNVGVSYPIIRSRDVNLIAGVNYEHRNSDTFLSDEHFQKDRLRALSASLNFDFSDAWGGITQFIPTVYCGLNIFDATDKSWEATNPLAPAEYWKFDLYASRDQQLPHNFSIFTMAEAQFSSESLSSYNKFSYGGSQFGRGYEPGIIEGDNAFAVSVEPRWTTYPTNSTALQLFSFIDYGTVWTSKRVEGLPKSEYGSSLGVGVRLWGHVGSDTMPDFRLSAFVAQPLKAVNDDDADSPRFVLQGAIYF